jgi:hypothetical protein
MRELVYVLTMEALIFGLLCVVLVAQRVDVFDWPAGHAWPVFSTSILLVLGYALFLLWLCCFIFVGRFGAFSHLIIDGCARTAGRLVSAAMLSVCYVAVLLWVHNQENSEDLPCLLNQLCGTSCAEGVAVQWSYGVYLAVLLPVLGLVSGLEVTAAGMCTAGVSKDMKEGSSGQGVSKVQKDTKEGASGQGVSKVQPVLSHRRLVCINCAYMLAENVFLTWELNAQRGCQKSCGVTPLPGSAAQSRLDSNIVQNRELLHLLAGLAVSDIFAELALWLGRRRLLFVLLFYAIRVGQVLGVAVRGLLQGILPWELRILNTSIAVLLCLLDITGAQPLDTVFFAIISWWTGTRIVPWRSRPREFDTAVMEAGSNRQPENYEGTQPTGLSKGERSKAFEVEPVRRRKFMLTFNATSHWPTSLSVPRSKKGS